MRKGRSAPETYIEGILKGDRVTLSRAITLIESTLESDKLIARQVIEACLPYAGKAYRIGITGPPGVGKSSFIDMFGLQLIEKGSKVAVLAIDPSSQKTKGSILGDKTRMSHLSHHASAYVRPSPSSASLGGVARKTRETMILCEAAGYQSILVETVGVGQSEIAVHAMVDFFILLLLPQAGDNLQGIKKGIMEMAHLMIIHKADGNLELTAKKKQTELQQILTLLPPPSPKWKVPVISCSSLNQTGFHHIHSHLSSYQSQMKTSHYWYENRKQQNQYWMKETIVQLIETAFFQHPHIQNIYSNMLSQVEQKKQSPIKAAEDLFHIWLKYISKEYTE